MGISQGLEIIKEYILIGKTMNGIMRRLPVKGVDGTIDLIEMAAIFYLEAQGDDTLIRTKRKKTYHSVQRLKDLARKLPVRLLCAATGNTLSI